MQAHAVQAPRTGCAGAAREPARRRGSPAIAVVALRMLERRA